MKTRAHFLFATVAWLIAAEGTALAALAATNAPPVETPNSVFVLPAAPKEGCDPFFPKSSRPYETAKAASHSNSGGLLLLTVKGFSGTPDHRFVVINNHTFTTGDEGEVSTPQGRIRIRCVEVKPNSVIIESEGQRQELFFHSNDK